jgi:LacI family transcriptional regulator
LTSLIANGEVREGAGNYVMAKVTLQDLATAAGVGTATAERAINGRGGVRPETVEKVFLAAKRINYRHDFSNAHRAMIRIEVILVRPETSFYSRMNQAFERIAASLDHSIAIHRTFVRDDDPANFAHHIANPKIRRSALIVVAPDHPEVVMGVRKAGGSASQSSRS